MTCQCICSGTRRALLAGFGAVLTLLAQTDAREIVRRAVAEEESNWTVARNYGFVERVDARGLDYRGMLKSQDVRSYDVILVEGSPYRRLAERNGAPLSASEAKKEQEKLARSVSERSRESAAQRRLRLAEYENRPKWQREAWHELPDAFDFRLAGEEGAGLHKMFVIEATARAGYQGRTTTAKALPHLRGKLWIAQRDYHLAKAEVEVMDTISVGLFLVRLAKGSRAAFEHVRVNETVWLPRRVHISASARVGLLKVIRFEQEFRYSECYEFQTRASSVPQALGR